MTPQAIDPIGWWSGATGRTILRTLSCESQHVRGRSLGLNQVNEPQQILERGGRIGHGVDHDRRKLIVRRDVRGDGLASLLQSLEGLHRLVLFRDSLRAHTELWSSKGPHHLKHESLAASSAARFCFPVVAHLTKTPKPNSWFMLMPTHPVADLLPFLKR